MDELLRFGPGLAILAAAIVFLGYRGRCLRLTRDSLHYERQIVMSLRERLEDREIDEVREEEDLRIAQEKQIALLQSITSEWKRKYWEMNDLVASCLEQRDEWKDMWYVQSCEHLEGQGVLEEKIVKMRQNLIQAIATCNRLMKDRDGKSFKPIRTPKELDPLDSKPVGQATAYRDRMFKMLKSVSKDLDAIRARDAITEKTTHDGLFKHLPLVTRAIRLSDGNNLPVYAADGSVGAAVGDWVVKDINGDPMVIKHDVFKRSFEPCAELVAVDMQLQDGEEAIGSVLELATSPA